MTTDLVDGNSQQCSGSFQDHPEWQDGDFDLVSSDGWRFKISSDLLFESRYVHESEPS